MLNNGTIIVFLQSNMINLAKHKILLFSGMAFIFSGCDVLNHVTSVATSIIPSEGEVANGLKEALIKGVSSGTSSLSQRNAFFADAAKKILLPPEVQNLESKIRGNVILNALIGNTLDKCVKAMNEGAENAMTKALPIFKNAVTGMSITDAMGILRGGQGSATNFLEKSTTTALHSAFKPEISSALNAVQITEYWNPIVSNINNYKTLLGLKENINPDLNQYVTEKASFALFNEIRIQENAIRNNPIERSTALLKKVFDYADTQK